MSKTTVPSNITNSTLFRDWLNTINQVIEEERQIYIELDKKAPNNHAINGNTYGVGSNELYGHLKLSDTVSDTLDNTKGTAATPKAVSDINSALSNSITENYNNLSTSLSNSVSDINARIDELESNAENTYAIKNHASTETTYGIGSDTLYGHLKLSDNKNSELSTESGTAVTPKALDDAYNSIIQTINDYDIDNKFTEVTNSISALEAGKAEKNHASTETTYGIGTDSLYGHLKIAQEYVPTEYNPENGNITEQWIASDTWQDSNNQSKAVSMNFLSNFCSDLKTVFSDLNTRIETTNSSLENYAIKNHASTDNTYGLGTPIEYGHLKITETFNENTTYSLNDSIAVSASAFSDFLYGETGYYNEIDNIITSINNISASGNDNEIAIAELQNNVSEINNELDNLDSRIQAIEDLPVSYGTYFFDTDLSIDENLSEYSTFICRGNSNDVTVTLKGIQDNFQFSIKNESDYLVKINAETGNTIDNATMPVILGKYDSAIVKQNPMEENVIDFTILSRNSVLKQSGYSSTTEDSISISMSNRNANYFDINSPEVTLVITSSLSNDSNNIEYSEKIVVFNAKTDTRIIYPNNLIWMNNSQPPKWGNINETLILKLLQIGTTVYATAIHNSQIVDDLDTGVKHSA